MRRTTSKHRRCHTTPTPKSLFAAEDYRSNDGMLTSIWGPATWHLLHCISFNYPVNPTPEQKRQYMVFVKSLQHVLPCGKCRENLIRNFRKLPLEEKDMASRETFSKYVYRLHEVVNKMLCKESGLSYEEVRETYEHFRARCLPPTNRPQTKKNREKGCVRPFNGHKTRCILKIVPDKGGGQPPLRVPSA